MPEGVEIASIAVDLHKKLAGRRLVDFRSNQHYAARFGDEYKAFCSLLPLPVREVTFKGKIIIFDLGEACFTSQLGMSGRWGQKIIKHTHLDLQFRGGKNKCFWMHYSDVRRFGMVRFYNGAEGREALRERLGRLGPDFLSKNPVGENEFIRRFQACRPRAFLGSLLMDQEKICSGVGNYILSELFYRCKFHPFIRVYDIDVPEISEIYGHLKDIMWEGLSYKGNSTQDYFNVNGEKGRYQNYLRVYMKKKDPAGNAVVRRIGPHGRAAHWVPKVQKKKRRISVLSAEEVTSDILELGISLLINPYRKKSELSVIDFPEIAAEYGLKETVDQRPHLVVTFGSDPDPEENPFVERIIKICL